APRRARLPRPAMSESAIDRAELLLEAGRPEDAEREARASLLAQPGDGYAHGMLARAVVMQGGGEGGARARSGGRGVLARAGLGAVADRRSAGRRVGDPPWDRRRSRKRHVASVVGGDTDAPRSQC